MKIEPEKRFQEWLESIQFVDSEGKSLPPVLEEETDYGEDGP
jgi:hypothetical protein